MDCGRTNKIGHETLMEVKEGNKPVELLKGKLQFNEFFSAGMFPN